MGSFAASRWWWLSGLAMSLAIWAMPTDAQGCFAPVRPFVPSEFSEIRRFVDLLKGDFEIYLDGIEDYFRCLDTERARAFVEARQVAKEYERLLSITSD